MNAPLVTKRLLELSWHDRNIVADAILVPSNYDTVEDALTAANFLLRDAAVEAMGYPEAERRFEFLSSLFASLDKE
uniref:Uncharacterized protein n=1 Tax=viral metagenome TaxID=1070528 RepID=A0A6H2A5W0_9ZZZZ